MRNFLCLWSLTLLTLVGVAQDKRDALAPKSDTSAALTEQLYGVTVATCDLEMHQAFFVKGMGMSIRKVAVSAATKSKERKLYAIPKDIDWELYVLERPSVPSAIKIRLMVLNKPTPTIHQSWNSLELGPFSLGFPNLKQPQLDSLIRKIGFGAQAAMNTYPVDAADGSKYTVYETIFNAPDFMRGVGITRGDGMPQLSPVEETSGMGGPGYSAMILKNSQQFIDFLTRVLGLELRSDRVWTTSGALGVPPGTKYRFALVYAKGAKHGHILLLEFLNQTPIETSIAPKIPNRGLGMWTFPTKDIKAVYENAKLNNVTVVQPPLTYDSPLFGRKTVMTLLAPNGFLIEIFEK
jgi:catechol 2,3-dioxygenase-like lactoylglutathione lyase family enzyme